MRSSERRTAFVEGLRDGTPIGLGYFAVAFSLGIAARHAGLTAFQGFLASLFNSASAGEYAAFTLMAADAAYAEVALMTLVTNARYLLMSCVLSQRCTPETPLRHRLGMAFAVTDEIFGISVARPGPTDPWYHYGAMLAAVPSWAAGTAVGILAGELLPARVVSALGVALFGMFIAVFVPPARKNRVVAVLVLVSFGLSLAAGYVPGISRLSEGVRTILLTVGIAAAAAVLFPVKDEEGESCDA